MRTDERSKDDANKAGVIPPARHRCQSHSPVIRVAAVQPHGGTVPAISR
jgi:hypothetical protein